MKHFIIKVILFGIPLKFDIILLLIGLHCEGIYRLSGVKSKVQQLRRQYNSGENVRLVDQEPHIVASLLKQYLR